MILTAHQPAYLPWLGFFHKMAISDIFIILDDVQYQKNYFTNRNMVKTAQGATWLTVPILTSGHLDKTIAEMKINNNIKWRRKHWKTIKFNYRKAAFFERYQDYFEALYQKKWINLFDLLNENIKFFVKELGIDVKIYLQSEFSFKKTKQELILEMCDYFDSDVFVFGKDGKQYADLDYFKENNRKIYFQDYNHPVYPQLYDEFISNLSIIDLLFNVGSKKAMEFIMRNNDTKNDLTKKYARSDKII